MTAYSSTSSRYAAIPLDLPPVTPIQVARQCYIKWRAFPTFEQDLRHYLENDIVISRPDIFAMARLIDYKGDKALFVRVAVGNLRRLLTSLPVLTPWICFHRKNLEPLRAYPLAQFLKIAGKIV